MAIASATEGARCGAALATLIALSRMPPLLLLALAVPEGGRWGRVGVVRWASMVARAAASDGVYAKGTRGAIGAAEAEEEEAAVAGADEGDDGIGCAGVEGAD